MSNGAGSHQDLACGADIKDVDDVGDETGLEEDRQQGVDHRWGQVNPRGAALVVACKHSGCRGRVEGGGDGEGKGLVVDDWRMDRGHGRGTLLYRTCVV